ncbi:hypothetical protein [Aeromonas veronii]
MMIYLQKRVIDQNGRSPSSTENSKIRCGMTDKAFQNMWAITALAYFHGLSNVSIRQQITKEGLEDDGDGLTFRHEGLIYWIPKGSIKL